MNLNAFNTKQEASTSYFAFDYATQEIFSVKKGILESNDSTKRIIFGFNDPNLQSNYPGWPLRNFLALISYHA